MIMVHKHGGNIKKIIENYNIDEKEIIDFSVNTNFLGPPEEIHDILENNITDIKDYPEPNSMTLKRKLTEDIVPESKNVIIGNGATEVIYQVVKYIAPKKSLILAPTFSEYKFAVESMNGKVENYILTPSDNFEIDLDGLLEKLNNDFYDMVFICNPNNPTGKLITREKIEIILEQIHYNNTFVVVDESFIDFVQEKINYTIVDLINKFNNLFIIRSFTKIFAIPGIRLGYGIGNEELIKNMEANRDPWSVNIFAQLIGEKIITLKQYYQKSRSKLFLEKDILYNLLTQINGIKPTYPEANFILINLSRSGKTSTEVTRQLAKKGIIVRNCNTFKNLRENYIRVAVGERSANMKLIKGLKEIILG
jgi:threonine-phosphate decarboxylase